MAKKYAIACDCGFSLSSHRKGEVVEFARMHVLKTHHQRISNAEAAAQVKTRRA
jgi:predicted small metal-binding protein